ncbi:MAG TPA: type II secretion system protein [Chthonomonadales bacterium]|nr:type II secretion system protein [Chthonomonadales bacterium]
MRILPATNSFGIGGWVSAAIGSGASQRRLAFTLVEVNVVIFILLILAAVILPSVAAIKRSRQLSDLEAAITRLPLQARNQARKSLVPVALQVQGNSLVMTQDPNGQNQQQLGEVDLNQDIQLDKAQRNGQPSDTGSWQWVVYPDGSSDSAGLEFTEGSAKRSLLLSRDGTIRWLQQALPDTTQDTWQAGQLQKRGNGA